MTDTTRCAPATGGSPPSTRCSATPRRTTPSTPPPSSACRPSPPNATSANRSPGSPNPRSTPCWPHPTAAPGPAGAITPCSSSPSRPDRGSPNSSRCPAATSALAPAPTSAASAKVAKNVPPHSPRSPSQCYGDGSPSSPAGPLTRCFPTRTGTRLSHDAIERRVTTHLAVATASCPSLHGKHVTMHTLRHTAAIRLLHAGNRHRRHRPLARPRADRHHPDLPACRHQPEGASDRPSHPAQHHTGPLPATRLATRLPGQPLVVPTQSARSPCQAGRTTPPRNNHHLGTTSVRRPATPQSRRAHHDRFPAENNNPNSEPCGPTVLNTMASTCTKRRRPSYRTPTRRSGTITPGHALFPWK